MKFTNQSGGSAPRKFKGYEKAGCEAPATSQQVELGYSRRSGMPVAAMAGSFARKIPAPMKAGQAVAGVKGKRGRVKG